ncbi:NESP55 domain containing protein [Asbolus verrucosus]|uniref:NESP55 domain containing protein n=1 Tax=Asbolus verrucosus TaxID=1661398 RepID=A0A482VC40_ASBVE|nr:NESP55 domain containing protein [Asbolus verrucosus]
MNSQTINTPTRTTINQFPKKDQTIILTANENLNNRDYATKIANLIGGAQHILFLSKISLNRVCIYLSSPQLVENLTAQYNKIEIGGLEIGLRRLITPSQRIILSNVCPTIPHDVLTNTLKGLGLKLLSHMTFLRAGIPGDEFAHILSFRRQIFIQPLQGKELPSSIVIKYDDTNYRIFLTDDLTCFHCKFQGHIAANCPEYPPENVHNSTPNNLTSIDNNIDCNSNIEIEEDGNRTEETESNNQNLIEPYLKDPAVTIGQKRPAETLTSTASEENTAYASQATVEPDFKEPATRTKKKPKRAKTNKSDLDTNKLAPVKLFLENLTPPTPITHNQLTHFFKNASGCQDPLKLVAQCTPDIGHFIQILRQLHSFFVDKGMKQRCNKYINRIERQIKNGKKDLIALSDTDADLTDCSQISNHSDK